MTLENAPTLRIFRPIIFAIARQIQPGGAARIDGGDEAVAVLNPDPSQTFHEKAERLSVVIEIEFIDEQNIRIDLGNDPNNRIDLR